MKILRSVTRRGFSVGTAGFFNVLRQNTWFPASRLPGSFSYLAGQSKGTEVEQALENPTENSTAAPPPEFASVPEQRALDQAGSQETTIHLQIMEPGPTGRRLAQVGLIVLAAAAITLSMLWWLARGRP